MHLAKHRRRPRLELKLWHSPDDLHALYRQSQDPVERSRWHALWLRATGAPIPQVAQTLGYSTRWVRDTLHRYRQGKPMADLRHQNPGQPPLLPPELQGHAPAYLGAGPPRGPEAGLELDEAPGLRSPPPPLPAPGEGPCGGGGLQKNSSSRSSS